MKAKIDGEADAPTASTFGSDASEVRLGPQAPDKDGSEFELGRTTSRHGIPMSLMLGPREQRNGKRFDEPTRVRYWRPPYASTLCPIARGYADQAPGADDMLVWYRSHGRERRRQVGQWLARRAIACGWGSSPMQTAVIVMWAMDRVTAGPRRIRPLPPPRMGQTKFEQLLAELSAWLRGRILDAEYRYRMVADPCAAAGEIPASRHNESRREQSVHYPTKPNFFLRKTKTTAPALPVYYDKAA